MKVLHVIDKSYLGGGQAAVRNLLLGARGSEVETHLSCRDGGPLVADARALGTPVHPVAFDKRFRPGPARAVARIVRREAIDVVHAHGLVAATYCTLARSLFGLKRPLLYHQHGFHDHNYGRWTLGARRAAERAVCSRADRVIPVSSADAERLEREGYATESQIELVYYGIPEPIALAKEVEEARHASGWVEGEPVVGLVGRLHVQKGIDVFLRALARVAKAVPAARFVIVGTGELEAKMHALSSELGLGPRLRWVGGRSGLPFLPLFDVAVLSSRWEGLPFVLLEYMAAGRAIVTTDVPGCLDAVTGDEAAIVPRDDPRAMAEAIVLLLGDRPLAEARARAARAAFEGRFSLAVMTRKFIEVYEELLAAVPRNDHNDHGEAA